MLPDRSRHEHICICVIVLGQNNFCGAAVRFVVMTLFVITPFSPLTSIPTPPVSSRGKLCRLRAQYDTITRLNLSLLLCSVHPSSPTHIIIYIWHIVITNIIIVISIIITGCVRQKPSVFLHACDYYIYVCTIIAYSPGLYTAVGFVCPTTRSALCRLDTKFV